MSAKIRTVIPKGATLYHIFNESRWADVSHGLRDRADERMVVRQIDSTKFDVLVEDSEGNLYRVEGRSLRVEEILTPAQAKAMADELQRHNNAIDGIWADGRLTTGSDRNARLRAEDIRHTQAVEAIREGRLEAAVDNDCKADADCDDNTPPTGAAANIIPAAQVARRRAQRQERQEILAEMDKGCDEPAPLRALEVDLLLEAIPVRPMAGAPLLIEVRSESRPELWHVIERFRVSGRTHSCTCEDFRSRKAWRKYADPKRACKHFPLARVCWSLWGAIQRLLDAGVAPHQVVYSWKHYEAQGLGRLQIAQRLIEAAARAAARQAGSKEVAAC